MQQVKKAPMHITLKGTDTPPHPAPRGAEAARVPTQLEPAPDPTH